MAAEAPTLNQPVFSRAGVRDGRRLLALPGVVAIVGAMITAAISFAILVGATPIAPNANTTWALIALNAAFVLFLIALVARQVRPIVMARRHGSAASRLHARIVAMLPLAAAISRVLVPIIVSV